MIPFRFKLETVLGWRRTQLDLEQAKLQREFAALAELDRLAAEALAAGANAELQVRRWRPVTGLELTALGDYRLAVQRQNNEIGTRRAKQMEKLAAQKNALLEAQRRCRLLERLKERHLEEWRHAEGRELEELASESFLAHWNRKRFPDYRVYRASMSATIGRRTSLCNDATCSNPPPPESD